MPNSIHIVSFDIPYPANYGGAIDVFHKLKALHSLGIEIYLHCFQYNRSRAKILEKWCKKVFFYTRPRHFFYQLHYRPFIVETRKSHKLLENLCNDSFPILFEGLHCCAFLKHPRLENRKKIVRTHNIEHEYYSQLALATTSIWKKLFFKIEAFKLKRFEKILSHSHFILSISSTDKAYFQNKYGQAHYLPAFHGINGVSSLEGQGRYLLFHGNLSVDENINAIKFILDNVQPHHQYKLIIAGKSPTEQLQQWISATDNVELIGNPSQQEMDKLITHAHIILLPTFQATGMKLKLIHSLTKGRFCIANKHMVNQTGMEHLCLIANSPLDWIDHINNTMNKIFNQSIIIERNKLFSKNFNDTHNAEKIIQYIF